jgi:hypothetical protein
VPQALSPNHLLAILPKHMAPNTQYPTCCFTALPNHLFLMISKYLSLKDCAVLADTCSVCRRSPIFEVVWRKTCIKAGLCIPAGISVWAMVKLLARPRVGVCNWSNEYGRPKGKQRLQSVTRIGLATRVLGFSQRISTSPKSGLHHRQFAKL